MPSLVSPHADDNDTPCLASSAPSKQRMRLLVVFEGAEDRLPREVETPLLLTLLPNIAVDQASVATPGAFLDLLSPRLITLSHYRLILVSTERLRMALCAALPGISDRIYRLDHFEDLSTEGRTAQDQDDVSHALALQQGLSHWAICLSQLLNAPSWYRVD
jgi:hypothetical protein